MLYLLVKISKEETTICPKGGCVIEVLLKKEGLSWNARWAGKHSTCGVAKTQGGAITALLADSIGDIILADPQKLGVSVIYDLDYSDLAETIKLYIRKPLREVCGPLSTRSLNGVLNAVEQYWNKKYSLPEYFMFRAHYFKQAFFGDLLLLKPDQFRETSNVGAKTFQEVDAFLKGLGLAFGMTLPEQLVAELNANVQDFIEKARQEQKVG